MNDLKVIINGSILNKRDAVLHINDLSIERGYAVFDYFKTVNGKPIFWEDNLDRFFYSAKCMRLEIEQSREELKILILQLMNENNIADSGIKLLLTGGYSSDGYSISKPNLIITQQTQKRNEAAEMNGIRLVTYEHQRQLPHVKTIDYLMGILTQPYVKEKNADDVLYKQNGFITECPRSNIFIVTKDERIITPEKNVLHGITRKHVLQIAAQEFKTETKDITVDELYNAAEVFVTSTSKNITPILSADEIEYGSVTGTITKRLQLKLNKLIYG